MKIATVTWITYNNYGTELQAYALQQYILGLGIDNMIISDKVIIQEIMKKWQSQTNSRDFFTGENANKSNDKKKSNCFFRKFKYICKPNQILKHIYLQIKNQQEIKLKTLYMESNKKIEEFKNTYLKISSVYNREEMKQLNEHFDLFIAGSDQIWSPLDKNFDGFFFLDFVSKPKGAYAPSLGVSKIPSNKYNIIKEYLTDYSFCSVREKSSNEELVQTLGIKSEWVCDPTLLFDMLYWNNFFDNIIVPKKKYILCYFLEDQKWYFDYAQEISKSLGLQLLLIPNLEQHCLKKIVYKKPVGPKEFVALFAYSDFVLTDSYHGTIFSLIFQKQFIHFKRFHDSSVDNQNIRVYSLLEYLNLEKIIVEPKCFFQSDIIHIDYDETNYLLNTFRKKSKDFLYESIFNLRYGEKGRI